jgi:ABC-type nitrate/sulfonate/bicarbonate transport system substrate-binding protein
MKITGYLIAVVACLLVLSAAQAQSTRVTVVYPGVSGGFTPLWIAQEKNLFAKYGVDVHPVYIQGGSRAVQALLAKDADVAVVSGGVIEAALRGADLKFMAAHLPSLAFSLYARPDIRQVQDLRGKVVGVTRYGTPTMYSAILALRKYGLDPTKDVKVLATGGVPETLAGMQAGTVNAGILSAPVTLRARKMGYQEILRMGELGVPFIHDGIVSSTAYVSGHQKSLESFLQGFIDGIRLYKADRSLAEKTMAKYTRVNDTELLRETYDTFKREFALKPFTPKAAIANMLQLIAETEPRAAKANPDDFFDNRLLQNLEKNGYFDQSVK